jgi:hypothetical protein
VTVAVDDFAGLWRGRPGEVAVVDIVAGHEDQSLHEVEKIAGVLHRIDRVAQEIRIAAGDADGHQAHILPREVVLEKLRVEVAVLLPIKCTFLELRHECAQPAGKCGPVRLRQFIAAAENVIGPDHGQEAPGNHHAFNASRGVVRRD